MFCSRPENERGTMGGIAPERAGGLQRRALWRVRSAGIHSAQPSLPVLRALLTILLSSGLMQCIAHPLVQDLSEDSFAWESEAGLLALMLIQPSPAQSTAEAGSKRLFITQSTTLGDFSVLPFGGTPIENIDAFCQADANNPDPGATFKAMVHAGASGGRRGPCITTNCSGGASEHVDWVFQPDTEYRRTDGTLVGRTMPTLGLFDFSSGDLSAPFKPGGSNYWTGMNSDWTEDSNCARWTNSGLSATIADSSAVNTFAISVGAGLSCSPVTLPVLCVEQ